MNIIVLPQAAEEFDDTTDYYEQRQHGLGHCFRGEVDRHIRWIAENAEIPRLRSGGYRRVNLKVFPHYIAYVCVANMLWILAIAHGHRKPQYWIARKQDIGQSDRRG
ncbi:MAG: type II toxin-antitoxin system RelE/ParE family toxin [Verrucomicrobia bacterium]|nr:type II toxin-antitoxin system RelE/ParE family toxin [Verrucomicrobiota bacterium]